MSGDPYWGSVVLLAPMEGANDSTTFTDYSSSPKTITAYGNAKISTAQSKWGDGSGYFDGTGDYLSIGTDTDFDFGSGDLTIEMWFRSADTAASTSLLTREWVGSPWTGGFTIQMRYGASGPLGIYMADYSTSSPLMVGSTTSHGDDNWHHFAWTKSGNVHRLFLDGVQEDTETTSASFASVSKDISIASDQTFGGRYFTGYIQDLRITRAARYVANFTPPTAAFDAFGPPVPNPSISRPLIQAFNPSIFNG